MRNPMFMQTVCRSGWSSLEGGGEEGGKEPADEVAEPGDQVHVGEELPHPKQVVKDLDKVGDQDTKAEFDDGDKGFSPPRCRHTWRSGR
jgi:hypothetical protein